MAYGTPAGEPSANRAPACPGAIRSAVELTGDDRTLDLGAALVDARRPDLPGEGPLLLRQREGGHRARLVAGAAVAGSLGRQRACAVRGAPAWIGSSRGRGPSVRPPCGRRRPAANGSGQRAPGDRESTRL